MMPFLKRYIVISPKYTETVNILDDGSGPTEDACEVMEIEAKDRIDAKLLGVKAMARPTHCQTYAWCSNDENPYVGVRVEEVSEEPKELAQNYLYEEI